ncbi:hypothetical protein DUI87_06953 [Hirundo rustica rustica]|uniref:Uncharacterized protein n=2 Tax=Neoaves TaxID=3078114 RepID=A0A3M0L6C2_HIRRU|nr:hypothetical protein DUI87_06953 [Hirundo rustica rustica]
MDTSLKVWPPQCPALRDNHRPAPVGHTIADTEGQNATGLLAHLGTGWITFGRCQPVPPGPFSQLCLVIDALCTNLALSHAPKKPAFTAIVILSLILLKMLINGYMLICGGAKSPIKHYWGQMGGHEKAGLETYQLKLRGNKPDAEEVESGQSANSSITDIQEEIRHCEKAATNSWFQQFSNLTFISRISLKKENERGIKVKENPDKLLSDPHRLQLTEGLHLKDDNWNFVSVDNSEQGTWPRVKGKLIVVGDCKHTPKEIEILPGTLDNNPGKFVLWLRCTHPPTFLPKGQTVAQIIPTWEHLEEDNIPTACPMHNITEVKPQVGWFELQEDKVQRMPPWRYLGLEIGKRTIVPQKLEIKAKIQTLADVHQLCGALNWVRPWLGLTTEDLAPLFNLLKGGEELSSPRELTPEAKEALEKVQHLMSTRQAHRCDPDLPFKFIIMGKLPHLHGVIFQWRNNIKKDQGREDPLLIIEWVFLSHQRSKRMTRPQELVAELIRKARVRIRELAGCDFECIHIPIGLRSGQITKAMLEHLLQENEALQFALDSFTGQISIHRPAHKIFNQDAKFTLNLKDVRSRKPLEALTVFTDASGKSHKSVMTWKDPQTQQWEADVAEVEGSPQVAELAAVVRAFERLQLTEGLHLKDDNWNFVSVDNSEQGTWPRVKGQTVAQIIPTWEHLEEDNIPTACPVHNITEVKPQVGCELQVGDEAINITGLLHTDMDVTVIPAKHWPSRWALENVAGHVQGIGGMQLAKQSKSVVQIKGPKGQLASLRPFVLDYREPLLGRDLMAQWGVTIDIPDPPQDFWAAVAEERPTHKLNWKTDAPVWVEQWPLSKQKLKALEELVEEQLAKGHIVETTSPWNSPVFVIRKPGKDKWRLLQDLRQINNVIEDMGSLQPGMPTPTMLPQNWKLAVIDIKDCFFHIPLHPDDAPRFAFSVPTVNREAPRKRYHWRVLPQGMKVSPIICQWYVASLLSPVRVAAEKAIIHHYMDDVLVCAPTDDVLSHALDLTINALVVAGFELQEDKVQRMPPWRYLGLEIGKRTIVPQKLEIKAKIQTLADVHQLCGALNWVRPWLGLTTEDLAPLFNLLKGGEELSSPRELTPEAKEALEKVQHLMSTRQAHRCDPDLPFKFIIMGKLPHLHGVIFQWRNNIKKDQGREDPLLIIEWVFLSHQRSKRMTRPQELVAELIRKARVRIRELAGCDFECIHIPIGLRSGQITKAMLEHLLQENEALQFALDSFTGQISIHRPAHKIFNQDAKFTLNLKDVRSRKPLEALTVFTDASGKSHKSVMTWKDPQTQQWEADVAEVEGSPQVAELAAVVRAFERFPEPFNLVTDSAYVAGVVSRADQAILQEVSNTALFELLSKLVKLVSHREQPFFVMHTRSHTDLPGFVAEGNRRADALAAPAAMAPLPSIFEQAKLSHQLHHQNAPGLVRRFHITREQAKAIVATCPSCNQHALPTLSAGVNPRGLNSCELWQTDVTHIPQFGRSKYVHVSVDTFSGAVFASAHAGEKTLDAIKHLIQAFSFMGIPKELKTDNGPAYRSKEFCSFLQQWGVGHKTGIPHSPTGQAVVERTHREIKRVLNQQQPVLKTETPQTRLARALFTLNFLNSTFEFLNPPIVRHFGANPQLNIKERPPVMVRDPETGRTEGPHDLVTWGRGYACVSTPTGPRWLPSKWISFFDLICAPSVKRMLNKPLEDQMVDILK